jgi:hypothetical protein
MSDDGPSDRRPAAGKILHFLGKTAFQDTLVSRAGRRSAILHQRRTYTMTATTNSRFESKSVPLLAGDDIRVLPIPLARGGGHLVLSRTGDRAQVSFIGATRPDVLLDCLSHFSGPGAPNIAAVRGGRMARGHALDLELAPTAGQRGLASLADSLNQLLTADSMSSDLLAAAAEAEELLDDIMDMTVAIPKDGPGILYAIMTVLRGFRLNVVTLESESFTNRHGALSAVIRARLELPRGFDLKSLESEIRTDDSTWKVKFTNLPSGTRPRRDARDLH